MKILLDMDQIICQFTQKIVEWWNQDHPDRPKTIEDIPTWNIDGGLGTEHYLRMCMRCPELWRDLSPVDGAIEGTRKLIDGGHQVRIVSAVPKSAAVAYHGKLQWIRDRMPFFDLDNFYAVHRKHEVEGDLLFDDGLHNVLDWVRTGRDAVVLDQPWNRDLSSLPKPGPGLRIGKVDKVYGWDEFLRLIEIRDVEIPF